MQAIILARRDFREFDQIISVYTKEKGKLELLARGVKKITSKNAAHLEPFCFVLIEVASGKEIDHLTKVVPIEMFPEIRKNLSKSMAAGYAMKLMDKLIKIGQPDTKIWELAREWLRYMDEMTGETMPVSSLLDAFVLRFFSSLGYRPILDRCVVCGKKYKQMVAEELVNRKKSGLYFAGGGLACPNCLTDKRRAGEQIAACGLKEISDVQLLLTASWAKLVETELSQDEKTAVHRLIYEFALYHSERRIGDWLPK